MSVKEIIAKAIDCPLMDTKNISNLIEDYCKYNILHEKEIRSVNLDVYSDLHECEDTLFIYDEEYYYILETPVIVQFIDGKPYTTSKENPEPIDKIIRNPDKYVFIETLWYIRCWEVSKRYSSYEEFHKAYKLQIYKWDRLLDPDFPEAIGDRIITIYYMGTVLFQSVEEDEGVKELDLRLREVIINLFNDDTY
jgi:hypothetical protein